MPAFGRPGSSKIDFRVPGPAGSNAEKISVNWLIKFATSSRVLAVIGHVWREGGCDLGGGGGDVVLYAVLVIFMQKRGRVGNQ